MIKLQMTRLFTAALLASTCGTAVLMAQSASTNEQTKAAIDASDKIRFTAMQHNDVDALSPTLGDGLVFIDTKGHLLNKEQYLDEVKSGVLKFISVENVDEEFHYYGNTTVMTGVANSTVEYHGKVNTIPRRFTSVYVKINGKWLLVAHQATLIAADK